MSKKGFITRERNKAFKGYPIGTIAFYGPTNEFASKVAVGIIVSEDADVVIETWQSTGIDVRKDPQIGKEIAAHLKANSARSVVSSDGIIGCPHEEGIDYPEGQSCPECPYWIARNRFTREIEQ
jgi:hypothetical protein